VELKVTDNGKGFDPETVNRGLGLTNISNRASLFNGSMELETEPGGGCTLKVYMPY
jgi:signal transduction histidine kinase